ncbi:MAG: hypothetical protein EOR51_11205 [Mesorhizobium sp.]|nr:hypothetical protein [Mesorhizobium sp.]RWH94070.1 MAG: hypothetical protein EOQ88_27045 [Mesorhizobium sp.]RWK82700.1 MAG: hypothetical protein EOR51_11205 [Mesorhizobium sp.]RWL06507.1 MAG: hypothetical protein EOR55_08990 [Mesorhizobium sp.]
MRKRLRALLLALLAASPSFAAESQAFLPARKAAAVLADGRPWSVNAPDGKTLKFTLKKNGTGSVSGPMPFRLTVSWTVMGETVCITGRMGTKCLRFSEIPGGVQGWDGDRPDLKFSR